MKKNKIPKEVVMTGIAALTLIEITALYNGIDGVLLSSIVGIIALAIGVAIPSPAKIV